MITGFRLQGVPNTDFTGILGLEDTVYEFVGETGDSLTALPHATVGDSYETFFDMRIPSDTVIEYDLGNGPQLFDPVYLNSIVNYIIYLFHLYTIYFLYNL